MLDACLLERVVPSVDVRLRDARVVAAHEAEDRRRHLARPLDRPGGTVRTPESRSSVEADRPGEPMSARGGEPGVAPAEAEADREDMRIAPPSGDRRYATPAATSACTPSRGGLVDVRHELELVVALLGARSASEVVDRDGGVPALGEAERQLLVETVEAADVGEHDHAHAAGLVGRSGKRGEAVAVGGFEDEVAMRDGRARERRDWRKRVRLEAHRTPSSR